jgi:hypothetical protein
MLETDLAAPAVEASPPWLSRYGRDLLALAYIATVAASATVTGAYYVMFPELGALSHEIVTRPRGRWASTPILLIITPALTGLIGITFTRLLPYGYLSVLLTVGGAVAVIEFLGSPIAPAISAGLLPLVIGVTSWWYPPGIVFGTVLLALLSTVQKRWLPPGQPVMDNRIDLVVASLPAARHWIPALFGFVLVALTAVELTGLRFILFPPLVVIAYEMIGHPVECPWTRRPWLLPIACFLTAAGGLICFKLMGFGPSAAACSMGWGVLVLHVLKIHVPPALAVGLLPMVMNAPGPAYPFSVLMGTTVITIWFLAYRRWALAESWSKIN